MPGDIFFILPTFNQSAGMPAAKAAQLGAFQYTASHWSTALLVGRDDRANPKYLFFMIAGYADFLLLCNREKETVNFLTT